jgi:hypothetical protein
MYGVISQMILLSAIVTARSSFHNLQEIDNRKIRISLQSRTCYLFTCDLPNDPDSSSDYKASNSTMW